MRDGTIGWPMRRKGRYKLYFRSLILRLSIKQKEKKKRLTTSINDDNGMGTSAGLRCNMRGLKRT